MSEDTSHPVPPPGFQGKWFVILLAPLLIGLSVWLFYVRSTFKHPTNLGSPPVKVER